ncbi:MAG TPA: cell division protein ZapA [Candidatus Levilactobacillus faecigallinarum]|uniref:Cell division protein ZapA n=1 Tax=Candidatus Levilactobacillus faecigallinarum TaxID=2838638 RepID=A0A9D1QTI8_9LACO|nr:cell division protein ZapA [Candidatus Levilactobacillus faecigallinarum]
MTEQKNRFKAVLANKPYTIVGNATDAHMRAVTELFNQQYNQLKQASPSMSKEDAAVLMAFNALSDQLKMADAAQSTADTQPTSETGD